MNHFPVVCEMGGASNFLHRRRGKEGLSRVFCVKVWDKRDRWTTLARLVDGHTTPDDGHIGCSRLGWETAYFIPLLSPFSLFSLRLFVP